jgi:hypothetical protein
MAVLSGVGGRKIICNLSSHCCLISFSSDIDVSLGCQLFPPPRPNSHFGRSFGTFLLMKNPKAQELWNLFAYEKSKA